MIELRIRAPNSQVYLKDQVTNDIAVLVHSGGVDATSGSITIATLQELDGETTLRLFAGG